jgi:hypothetical protein
LKNFEEIIEHSLKFQKNHITLSLGKIIELNFIKTMIAKPIEVKALDNYTIFVWFSDGVQGSIDLKHLAHKGVFHEWDKNNLFTQVHIDDYGAIAWNDDIDICPDSVYLQLKGLTFEQWQNQDQCQYASNQ